MVQLIRHHVKYKEIHGVDEVVIMDKSIHTALHARLRREGKCNIPSNILCKISSTAHSRDEWVRKYRKDNIYTFMFNKTIFLNVYLQEKWRYDKKTGTLFFTSDFVKARNKKLHSFNELTWGRITLDKYHE